MRPYLYFKSNMKREYRPLSNFAPAPITLDLTELPTYASLLSPSVDRTQLPALLDFPSSEHAWQALKADDTATFRMFMTDGFLSRLTPEVFEWLTTKKEWGKKMTREEYGAHKVAYYSRGGIAMVGIVAKMAASPERARRLGYALRDDREFLEADVEEAVWIELLAAKFSQNEEARRTLLGTGNVRIVEHDKGARKHGSHWGGLVNPDGSVTGANKMGLFLERVRDAFPPELRGTKRLREEEDDEEEAPKKKRQRTPVVVLPGDQSGLLIDEGEARVPYEPAFFAVDEANTFFETLLKETEWTTETIKRWNREMTTPRRVFAFSDPNVVYRYISLSRTGAPWTPTMEAIKKRVEDYCSTTFNFCFANLYRDGQDTIGWHSDDEKALIPGHKIASVSLSPGAERDLLFKDKTTGERRSVQLAHGSLYVMEGATQKRYKHSVPRRPKVTKPRINLTFRQIRVEEAQ